MLLPGIGGLVISQGVQKGVVERRVYTYLWMVVWK